MISMKKLVATTSLAVLALGMGGCSSMSAQDKNTAIGAGAGAVLGGVLTGGSTAVRSVAQPLAA